MSRQPPQFPRLQTDSPILNRVEDLIKAWGIDLASWALATFSTAGGGGTISAGLIVLPERAVPFGSAINRMTWDLTKLQFDDANGRLVIGDVGGYVPAAGSTIYVVNNGFTDAVAVERFVVGDVLVVGDRPQ